MRYTGKYHMLFLLYVKLAIVDTIVFQEGVERVENITIW